MSQGTGPQKLCEWVLEEVKQAHKHYKNLFNPVPRPSNYPPFRPMYLRFGSYNPMTTKDAGEMDPRMYMHAATLFFYSCYLNAELSWVPLALVIPKEPGLKGKLVGAAGVPMKS